MHVSEMSWTRRVRHPSKLVNVGDEVDVIVLDVNQRGQAHLARHEAGRGRIRGRPSRSATQPGSRVRGQGAQPDRLRRLHRARAGRRRPAAHLRHVVDPQRRATRRRSSRRGRRSRRRSSTSTRTTSGSRSGSSRSSPIRGRRWPSAIPMGSRVTGKVVRLTDFGAFVELEPGVDGLLHISQMSSRPIATPARDRQRGRRAGAAGDPRRSQRAAHRAQPEASWPRDRGRRGGRGAGGAARAGGKERQAALGLRLRRTRNRCPGG